MTVQRQCRRGEHLWSVGTTWDFVEYAYCENCGREAPVQDWELP